MLTEQGDGKEYLIVKSSGKCSVIVRQTHAKDVLLSYNM